MPIGLPRTTVRRGRSPAWHSARVLAPWDVVQVDAGAVAARKRFVWCVSRAARAAQAATCFHATSLGEVEDIRRLGFRQPVAVVPNGVDLPALGTESSCRSKRSQQVLFLSRIHPKKGIPILLRAWRSVERGHPDWELVVAGPDEGGHLARGPGAGRRPRLRRVSFPGPAYGEAKARALSQRRPLRPADPQRELRPGGRRGAGLRVPVVTTTGAPWAGSRRATAAGGSGCRSPLAEALEPRWLCRRRAASRWAAAAGAGPRRLWLGGDRDRDQVDLRLAARRRSASLVIVTD